MKQYALAVVDHRMDSNMRDKLKSYAEQVLPLPSFETLQSPVCAHPDMLMWQTDKCVVTYRSYRHIASQVFDLMEQTGYTVICEDDPTSENYPHDVGLNCANVGRYVIANRRTISKKVAELCERSGLTLLHTNQGYAKCSTLTLTDNAVITADRTIHAVCTQNGIDSLLIREGGIRLDGYDHGFIGGTTGVTDTHVLFTGDLCLHPDGKAIFDFCHKHKKIPLSLSNSPLYDFGTIFFIR